MEPESKENPEQSSEEDKLLELAKKELLREIKCASLRAEQFGAHSWAKPQHYVPSKRFLRHMLISASRNNNRKEQHNLGKREKIMKHDSNSSSRHTLHTKHTERKRDHMEENGTHNSKRHKHKHKKEDSSIKDRKKSNKRDDAKSERKKHHREK